MKTTTICFAAAVAAILGFETTEPVTTAGERDVKTVVVRKKTGRTDKRREKKTKKKESNRKKLAVKSFMYGKLDATKQLMEGLVTEDYELILRGTDKLRVMSMRTEWNVVKGPVYEQHSHSFRRSAERIAKAAKNRNVDGATLEYLSLTMKCINCHKYTRER